jgi:two-component system phosphate regulon sensor histidine kinase PhoR
MHMSRRPALPLPGLVLLAIALAGMALAGADWWLVLAVAVIWTGSLWLTLPAPEIPFTKVDAAVVSRDAVYEVIEHLGQPLLLLDDNRIVMANAAARAALGAHVVNQDARIALRHPEAMRLLDLEDGTTVSIPGFTGARSLWELTRRKIHGRRWLIELADKTAEADVSRAHTDFVANASHELRTPLASVIGYLETLGDAKDIDAPTRQRFTGIAKREAERMLSLVEDLMSLSRAEAEKQDQPSEKVDLRNLAERVVAEIATVRGKKRVDLDVGAAALPIAGDPAQLEQLLRNLVDNGLKYGDPEQPVAIAARSDDAGMILTVTDIGPGIAPEHLPHLTRRFYRTDPGRSRASGGTGLGLAIVKHIVERHRARLDIDSTVGLGTTVTVTFPKFPADAASNVS